LTKLSIFYILLQLLLLLLGKAVISLQNDLKCGNCGTVTLADGQQVWVCEHCGTENVPETVTQPASIPPTGALDMTAPMTPPASQAVASSEGSAAPQPTPVNPTQVVQ